MKDIQDRNDIQALIAEFYTKAMSDDVIKHFFIDVAHLDLNTHLPIICDFLEGILFDSTSYKRNTMLKHIELNSKSPLKPEHFNQWLRIWNTTVDDLFVGTNAETAKSRASQIAQLMQYKIKNL